MISSISTYPVQFPVSPDTQHTPPISSRQKRSLEEQDLQVSAFETTSSADKPRRRTGGGMDSLGRGNLL